MTERLQLFVSKSSKIIAEIDPEHCVEQNEIVQSK